MLDDVGRWEGLTLSGRIDKKTMIGAIEKMAELVDKSAPPYTRRAFTETYLRGREWLKGHFEASGLDVRLDAAANLIGRMEGLDPTKPPIVIGSHTDTVMGGGRYDGILGVLAGAAVASCLHRSGQSLRFPLEVVDFLSEEVSDYGAVSCVGSRAMVGTLSQEMLSRTNSNGEMLKDAIRRMGGNPDLLNAPLRRRGDIAAYLELHIEQGPVLDTAGIPIGVVSGIVAIRRVKITVKGQANHAGTTPMKARNDALVGASQMISLVHDLALDWHGHFPLVATVGRIEVFPNSPNVIPGLCIMDLEVRSVSEEEIGTFLDRVREAAAAVNARCHVSISFETASDALPALCSKDVVTTIKEACSNLGYEYLEMPSGAGHDAMHVASIAPIGMIFVPSVKGLSHCSEEFTKEEHIIAGAEVLLESLLLLNEKLGITPVEAVE